MQNILPLIFMLCQHLQQKLDLWIYHIFLKTLCANAQMTKTSSLPEYVNIFTCKSYYRVSQKRLALGM